MIRSNVIFHCGAKVGKRKYYLIVGAAALFHYQVLNFEFTFYKIDRLYYIYQMAIEIAWELLDNRITIV
ncbi:hypothetical protein DBR11_12630 [Pedobacter sp. HMWF019]|nr:hypothetical protein DBR11_12630 [Pedobacter sp. HMWF019]